MADLHVAIIGCGGIALSHMEQFYKQQNNVKVVACMDPNVNSAASFSQAHQIDHAYSSFDELMAKETNLDAIDICTPPQYHTFYAHKAISAAKHVITEKPFSLDYEEAKKVVDEAAAMQVKLMVMQNYRWRPEYVKARAMIKAKQIGSPTLITITSRHDLFAFGADEYRKKMERMSLFEISIHYIDLFRFLTGSDAKIVFALTGRKSDSPYVGDTFSVVTLKLEDGCICNLVTSAETIGARINWGAETVIQGTNGTIWLNRDSDYEFKSYSRVLGGASTSTVLTPVKGWFGEPLRCFYESIEGNTEPPSSGKDNLKSLEIILSAYESATHGKSIIL